MINFKTWFSEMSIQNLQRLGDWEPEKSPSDAYVAKRTPKKGYYQDDFGILTNDVAIEKIKRKWSKTKQPFNLFFLRSKEGARVREVGEVDVNYLTGYLRLPEETVRQVDRPDMINVIFTNNLGAERMPANWWTLAHRLGHAIRLVPAYQQYMQNLDKEMHLLLYNIYNYERQPRWSGGADNGKMLLALANGIGGMKSARENNLRNLGEFYHEVLSQYIIEGTVRFRDLPRLLVTGYAWGKPRGRGISRNVDSDEVEGWNDFVHDHWTSEVNRDLDVVLNACVGKIFVM